MMKQKRMKQGNILFFLFPVLLFALLLSAPVYSVEKKTDKPIPKAGGNTGKITVKTEKEKPKQKKDISKSEPLKEDLIKLPGEVKQPKSSLPDSRLTIEQAVSIALKNNLQLRAGKEKIVKARSQFNQAESHLNIKSSLEGRTQVQGPSKTLETLSPVELPSFIDGSIRLMEPFDALGGVKVEKILTTFGKIEHQKAAAFIRIEAERQGLESLKNDVTFQVKQTFYNILKTREALKVAREYLKLTTEYKDQAVKLHKAGIVSKFDVLKADVAVAESKKNIISARKGLDLSKSMLLLLLNEDEEMDFEIKDPPRITLSGSITLKDLQECAINNRSEISQVDTYIRVADKMIDAAKSNNKPDLVASGEFGYQLNPMGKGIIDNYGWNVGISFKIPLFDGGETKAKVDEAKSDLRELKVNREALAKQVRLQVKEAWLSYREARAKVEVVKAELAKSKESYFLAKARYSEGVSIALEMNEALVSYNNSKRNLFNAIYDLNVAFSLLEKAIGKKIDESDFTKESPVKLLHNISKNGGENK